jgi:hypothetical protein
VVHFNGRAEIRCRNGENKRSPKGEGITPAIGKLKTPCATGDVRFEVEIIERLDEVD